MRVSTLLLAACAVFAAPIAGLARTVRPVASSGAGADLMIDSSNIGLAFAEHAAPAASADWAHFKATHGKRYTSAQEEARRFAIFQANMQAAQELNKKNPEATFGATKFSDLDPREFKRMYSRFEPSASSTAHRAAAAAAAAVHHPRTKAPAAATLPELFDWRLPNDGRPVAVTAVKDQGNCGSCWAFSATEATESAFILAGNPMTSLAPEQLVECDTGDNGCHGGDTTVAFAYIESHGFEAESSYGYVSGVNGTVGTCVYDASKVVAKISGFSYATPPCTDGCTHQDEGVLRENLYTVGPASVCVDSTAWQNYVSGILNWASGCTPDYNNLDHCVQLVGYGVDRVSGQAFWSVRNSWTDTWGEAGYIRLAAGNNTCGMADAATQVQIAHLTL